MRLQRGEVTERGGVKERKKAQVNFLCLEKAPKTLTEHFRRGGTLRGEKRDRGKRRSWRGVCKNEALKEVLHSEGYSIYHRREARSPLGKLRKSSKGGKSARKGERKPKGAFSEKGRGRVTAG